MTLIAKIALSLLFILLAPLAHAQLTPTQMATLKTACLADPVCAPMAQSTTPDDFAIAAWFNGRTETYIIWRNDVLVDDIMRNGMDWTRVDNLSAGKARIWDWMTRLGTLNCTRANIRAGIDATWVGTAADLAVRATVYTHCKRAATRAEKALANGSGTDASPSTPAWTGLVTYQEASLIRS